MQAGPGVGDLLDDRYRIDEHCQTVGDRSLWRATDTVLDRNVAVRLLADHSRTSAKEITAAAGQAGAVPDARWVRVLDVGTVPAGRKVTVWIVSEWVDGHTLTSMLRREPLRPAVATELVMSCAQAVASAARAGARHGRLHPDEVLIAADGSPRLTGLEIRQALTDDPAYDDVLGLGALLFAALTGHWPLRGWDGLPAVRRGDGRHPRTQRRSVPRAVDEVVARCLDGGFPDAQTFARALARLPRSPINGGRDDAASPSRHRLKRIAWWVVPPLLIAGAGAASWSAGSRLGRVPGADRASAQTFRAPQHATKGTRLVWKSPPTATSFDPQGDGSEDPGGVGLAVDDDPSTVWSTDIYHGGARFGGLKQGVGLLLDLGRARTVDTAHLLLTAPGADIELQAGQSPPGSTADLPVVASSTDAAQSLTMELDHPVHARYWLVWITQLPKTSADGYSLGIAEVTLLH